LDLDAQYDGAEFLRSQLDREDIEDEITAITNPDAIIEEEDQFIPDTRLRGLDQLSFSANARYAPANDVGILNNPAVSVRGNYSKTGALKTSDAGGSITNLGISGATNIGETGLSVSADASYFTASFDDDRPTESGRQFTVQAFKQFDDYTVRAQYRNDKSTQEDLQQALSATVSRRAFNVPLPKDANLSLSPSASALYNGDTLTARGGVFANLHSGRIFGQKNRVDASFGVLQSVSGFNGNETDKFLTVSVARQLRLGSNLALGLAYRNDLNGSQRVGMQLTGRYEFNEKRRYRRTEDGKGVLKGRAFLDDNRDGIKQDTERALPRVLVKVKGTGLALRTDNAGFYTIQNIKEGIYELQVDARTLPLGFDLSEDVTTKATIAEGQITDVPVPIVQRGQIRGFAFIDENGNGTHEKGEERIEGAKLKLTSTEGADIAGGEAEEYTHTTSFGQYAFDDLAAGEYHVEVIPNEAAEIAGGVGFTLNIADKPNLMGRRNIIISREKNLPLGTEERRIVETEKEPNAPIEPLTKALTPKIKDTTVIAPDL